MKISAKFFCWKSWMVVHGLLGEWWTRNKPRLCLSVFKHEVPNDIFGIYVYDAWSYTDFMQSNENIHEMMINICIRSQQHIHTHTHTKIKYRSRKKIARNEIRWIWVEKNGSYAQPWCFRMLGNDFLGHGNI